ncbi:MAG TPA: hypothetical protein PKZ52_17405, partial [Cellvibrionaceae bacterium]|nr:hypothetical protein [Cellvibrionaceae bacterium]
NKHAAQTNKTQRPCVSPHYEKGWRPSQIQKSPTQSGQARPAEKYAGVAWPLFFVGLNKGRHFIY